MMDTLYRKIQGTDEDGKLFEEAGKIIRSGGLVAFPTETVYGLGGDGLDPEASKKIYAAKGRPSDNPLILHISDEEELLPLVSAVPESAKGLMKAFWPGPMTLVFKKSSLVPYETTGGLDTVAIRMPSHDAARRLIKAAGVPIAAPSANRSGRPSPTSASHVLEDMDGRIDMILDGGEVPIGLESTIIDVTGDEAVVLRPGYIGVDEIREVAGSGSLDPAIIGRPDPLLRPKAPGMKYRHYAPKADITIVRSISRRADDTDGGLGKDIDDSDNTGSNLGKAIDNQDSIDRGFDEAGDNQDSTGRGLGEAIDNQDNIGSSLGKTSSSLGKTESNGDIDSAEMGSAEINGAPCTDHASAAERVAAKIIELAEEKASKGYRTRILCAKEHAHMYPSEYVRTIGELAHEETIAHNLYKCLRDFDLEKVDFVFSEAFGDDALGSAIMNRLTKAAGYHIIEV